MNFCTHCGERLVRQVPEGDSRLRHVCPACRHVHYVNPKVVAGAIPQWEGQILLCRRAIEPRRGGWTLPAGFLEDGETMAEGARREAIEEAHASVEIEELYALYSVPHISQVYAFFRSRLLDLDFRPGAESLEVRLYREEEIPWRELAFPAVHKTLELFFADRRQGRFRTHAGDILRHPGERFEPIFRIRSN